MSRHLSEQDGTIRSRGGATSSLRQRPTRALDRAAHGGARPGPYPITVERDLRVPMDDGAALRGDL